MSTVIRVLKRDAHLMHHAQVHDIVARFSTLDSGTLRHHLLQLFTDPRTILVAVLEGREVIGLLSGYVGRHISGLELVMSGPYHMRPLSVEVIEELYLRCEQHARSMLDTKDREMPITLVRRAAELTITTPTAVSE